MATFFYRAADKSGREIQGRTEASAEAIVEDRLRSMGYFPAEIQKVRDRGAGEVRLEQLPVIRFLYRFLTGGRVHLSTLENFTRELATLLGAGIPLLRSLQILQRNVVSTNLKSALTEISEHIENGASFSDALARHPQVFDRLFLNMVKAGEVGGVLEESLDRLAVCYEKSAELRGKVLSALYYPVTVFIIAITLVTLILTFIVPRLQEIYEGMGGEFPAMTLLLIRASEAVRFKASWLIGGVFAVLVLILQVRKTRPGRRLMDAIQLKVPLFGVLFQKAAVARFARTLATLLHAGVPILQALAIVKDSSGNESIASAMIDVHASIREGGNMAEALKNHSVFPDLMVHMIAVGEESGSIDAMLGKVADSYERQVDHAVSGLASLLEPVLIVFLGILIGFIVIALYLPLLTPPSLH